MKETLRILFSAAFLSAVFLVAYNYVNTSTNGNQNPLSSLWGSNSDQNGEEESAPADDSFQFPPPESLQPTTNQTVVNPSPSFDNKSDNALLPLPGPESQKAAVSDPYALQAPTDVVVPPINDGSSVAPAVPVESNVATFDPLESVAPIDPDDAVDNSAPPTPMPLNNPPAAQDESVKTNPEREAVAEPRECVKLFAGRRFAHKLCARSHNLVNKRESIPVHIADRNRPSQKAGADKQIDKLTG